MEIKPRLSRGVLPALQALAVEAVVAQCGQDPVHRLVHPLQAHGALGQLCQVHHGQAGPLQAPSTEKVLSTFPSPAINSSIPSLLAPGFKTVTRERCEATQCLGIYCKDKKVIPNIKGPQPGLSEGAAPATSPTVLCGFPKLQPKGALGHKVHGVTTQTLPRTTGMGKGVGHDALRYFCC